MCVAGEEINNVWKQKLDVYLEREINTSMILFPLKTFEIVKKGKSANKL